MTTISRFKMGGKKKQINSLPVYPFVVAIDITRSRHDMDVDFSTFEQSLGPRFRKELLKKSKTTRIDGFNDQAIAVVSNGC